MALIKCPECGKEISDKAESCPNCGCPIKKDEKAESLNPTEKFTRGETTKKQKKKGGFLKILLVAIAVFVVIGIIGSIAGGGSGESKNSKANKESKKTESEEKVYIKEEEIPQLFSDPEQFKGKYVKLTGKVFAEPEDTGDYIGLQVWNKPEEAENNFLVKAPKDDTGYTVDSYVIVEGKIEGEVTGTNVIGGEVSAPMINADKVEVSTYKDVVMPTIQEYSFADLGGEQYGYSVYVTKVELAEKETRVYMTVKNSGGSEFSIFGYGAKIIQNGQQYEAEANYNADYPELQTEILPGTESSGVLVFPHIEADVDFQIYIEGYSENWDEQIQPYNLSALVQEQ